VNNDRRRWKPLIPLWSHLPDLQDLQELKEYKERRE
jgi:hypothetical protein